MLGNDGRVAITDFGIARSWQPTAAPAQATNDFVGTPAYMSPEQAEGAALDLRTDVYSLGVMLFELLTGTVPFTGATPLITAAARLIKPVPDPRTRRPELPEAVARVVLRCLAKAPADRYASADEVAAALTLALQTTGFHHSDPGQAVSVLPQLYSEPGNLTSTSSPTNRPLDRSALSTAAVTLDVPTNVRTVAVLPFINQGPAEDSYLAAGLTDDLLDSLSMVSGLRVRSRSALPAQAETADPLVLGRTLAVDFLVSGTVRRIGPQLRIAARLVMTADGVQVWAQRFDRPAGDVLRISDEVAQAVAAALTLTVEGPARTILDDAQAVDLYLRARALNHNGDPQSILVSIPLYEQALALRPRDPTLLTSYAHARARIWFAGGERAGELAIAAAEKAVAAAPDRGEPHLALAVVRFHVADPAGAVHNLKLALKIAPALAAAHELLGRILLETDPYELGLRHIQRAMELEPSLWHSRMDLVRLQSLFGNWEAAERQIDDLQRQYPTALLVWMLRGRLLLWRRDRRDAAAYLQKPELAAPQLAVARRLMQIAAGEVRIEPKLVFDATLDSATSSPRGRCFFHQMETELFASYGETESAMRSLARAADIGLFDKLWVDYCPLLVTLRKDPRYPALRKIIADRAAKAQEALTA